MAPLGPSAFVMTVLLDTGSMYLTADMAADYIPFEKSVEVNLPRIGDAEQERGRCPANGCRTEPPSCYDMMGRTSDPDS
jgi:hypothetical protein